MASNLVAFFSEKLVSLECAFETPKKGTSLATCVTFSSPAFTPKSTRAQKENAQNLDENTKFAAPQAQVFLSASTGSVPHRRFSSEIGSKGRRFRRSDLASSGVPSSLSLGKVPLRQARWVRAHNELCSFKRSLVLGTGSIANPSQDSTTRACWRPSRRTTSLGPDAVEREMRTPVSPVMLTPHGGGVDDVIGAE